MPQTSSKRWGPCDGNSASRRRRSFLWVSLGTPCRGTSYHSRLYRKPCVNVWEMRERNNLLTAGPESLTDAIRAPSAPQRIIKSAFCHNLDGRQELKHGHGAPGRRRSSLNSRQPRHRCRQSDAGESVRIFLAFLPLVPFLRHQSLRCLVSWTAEDRQEYFIPTLTLSASDDDRQSSA